MAFSSRRAPDRVLHVCGACCDEIDSHLNRNPKRDPDDYMVATIKELMAWAPR